MDYIKVFKERFKKLNEEQKKAVESIEGPVMVIAGPGTGKTEILAARIANILNKSSGSSAYNILCLTYTDAGTVAMRKRLLKFIGPDAYKVNIYTFHGFCNMVIQDNLEYFAKRELQTISELEKVQFLEKLISSFDVNHPLFKSTGYYELKRLKDLFAIMKSENWSVVDIENAVQLYLKDIPNREKFQYKRANSKKNIKVGDLKESLINAEKKKMDILLAAVREFPQYTKMLKDSGRYDYEDMILWVLKAFQENQEILARYQEQYLYMLVDEFQDTNGSQNEILNLLSSFWDNPNIFVVGDDDQSIFRFQGANLRNIMNFYEKYKKSIEKVVVSKNYRSSQKILDLAKDLIEENKERLISEIPGLEKNLTALNPKYSSSTINPRVIEYYNSIHEEISIVKEIEELQKNGVNLNEVAVIYREHRQAMDIIKLLEQKKISVNVKESTNILQIPFIKNIISILEYISGENESPYSQEHALFQILHYKFFNINASDIAMSLIKLREWKRKESYKRNESLQPSLLDIDHTCSYLRSLLNMPDLLASVPNMKSKESMYQLGVVLDELISSVSNYSLIKVLEKILVKGSILKYVMNSYEKVWLMRALTAFSDFLKEEVFKNPDLTLKEFLKILKQMKDHNIGIPLSKMTFAKDGVNFLTAHSSKGLEFKYVFLISTSAKSWDKKGSKFGYFFPDTLTLSNTGDHIEESRRLFYVAITRAKEHLSISYSARDMNGKDMEHSRFVEEILAQGDIVLEEKSVSDEEILEGKLSLFSENEYGDIGVPEKEYLDEILKSYKLSPTHLNKYLRCPVAFYFENILNVPFSGNEYMSFGSAIHYALEYFFRDAKKNAKFGAKDMLFKYFENAMNIERSSFSDDQYKRRLEYGKNVLDGYYSKYKDTWDTNVIVEYNINNVSLGEIPIRGKLDKIEFDGNRVNVVDYKTGKYLSAQKRLVRPNEEDSLGGDYWRQLVFYKILIDNDSKQSWFMESAEMDFVEKDSKTGGYKKTKILITKEDEDIVKGQIERTYEDIMNQRFDFGCGEDNCMWCEFIKEQQF